jgi:hypothetical protein
MKQHTLLSLAAAALLAGCASGHFSSGVKTVGVNTAPLRGVTILAPDKATVFAGVARDQNGWLEGQIRASIDKELAQSDRFRPAKGADDGRIVFNSLRHGLLEVSPNNYAAQIVADVSLVDHNGKTIGNRELSSTSGDLHPLVDFEYARTYQQALAGVADKLALELVNDL